nr:phasin family protein [Gammaproteobacteria bacterium]
MQHNFLGYWLKLRQEASASIMHLGRLSVRSSERSAQHQLNAIRLILDGNRKQVQQLAQAGGPWEILAQQPHLAADMGLQVLEHALETLDILVDARDALRSWLTEEANTFRIAPLSEALMQLSPPALHSTASRSLH